MVPISVVIITKNEAATITACINAAQQITDDIVIIDNDSTDGTTLIAAKLGCRVFHENWDGYGANKNKGAANAKYDWILSIDADEVPDEALIRAIHALQLDDALCVYDIRFRSYYGNKAIYYGSWGRDHHIRLFNRVWVKWDTQPVHEALLLPPKVKIEQLGGYMHHYSVKDKKESYNKTVYYARLSAEKYYLYGRRATAIKLYIAPLFHFLKNYIVFLGVLDGRAGWEIAWMIARHTRLKYRLLKNMYKRSYAQVIPIKDDLVVEY
jgi:glycosyltransferase involved in cell wall biosynthesis